MTTNKIAAVVIYDEQADTFKRSLYVKYYPRDTKKDKAARVYFSVQVEFTSENSGD